MECVTPNTGVGGGRVGSRGDDLGGRGRVVVVLLVVVEVIVVEVVLVVGMVVEVVMVPVLVVG